MDAGAAGELSALLKEFAEDPALLEELKQTFGELKTRLESAVTLGDECADPQDTELLRKALSCVEPLLLKGDGK